MTDGITPKIYVECFVPQKKAPKGSRQEQKKRVNARIEYAAAIERWEEGCPPVMKFWAIKKWLRAMPRRDDFYD